MKTAGVVILLTLVCLSIYLDPTVGEVTVRRPYRPPESVAYRDALMKGYRPDQATCKKSMKQVAESIGCPLPESSLNSIYRGPTSSDETVRRKYRHGHVTYADVRMTDQSPDQITCKLYLKRVADYMGCPFPGY